MLLYNFNKNSRKDNVFISLLTEFHKVEFMGHQDTARGLDKLPTRQVTDKPQV